MKFRLALVTATCLALPLAAHAQPVTGPYVRLGLGTSLLESTNFSSAQYGTSGKVLFRPSYSIASGMGYGFGNGFRVELGLNMFRDTVHEADINSVDGTIHARAYGAARTYGPMISGLYDIDVGWPVFPYVGAGIGYEWVKLNRDINSSGVLVGGTRGSFAYQIIAGLSYPLPWVPGLAATAEYRFMQLTASRNYYGSVDGESSYVKLGQQYYHTFLIGLRYQWFNPPPPAPAPAPAPVAAPAPAPAKTYLVFFDWDKYNLTPRATQIVAQAASDSKTQNVTTLDVSGYTDTSGTPQYNMGLSERRAKAVAAQLVTDGVPASEIEIHAYGETHLLVPTGPNVREPQNRRVEIVMQ
ncbi:MAG: OmpA family protein [Acidocella sp.]